MTISVKELADQIVESYNDMSKETYNNVVGKVKGTITIKDLNTLHIRALLKEGYLRKCYYEKPYFINKITEYRTPQGTAVYKNGELDYLIAN